MTSYYLWPALAIGLVVAARCSLPRFEIALALAVAATVLAQWRFGWIPWWAIQMAGLTGVLIVSSSPRPFPTPERVQSPDTSRSLPATR